MLIHAAALTLVAPTGCGDDGSGDAGTTMTTNDSLDDYPTNCHDGTGCSTLDASDTDVHPTDCHDGTGGCNTNVSATDDSGSGSDDSGTGSTGTTGSSSATDSSGDSGSSSSGA